MHADSPLLASAHRLTRRVRHGRGRGGSVTHTISGIDIALWDIFGKLCGQPISRLLGGRYREKVRPYGSLLMAEPDEMRRRIKDAMDRGFRSFKIGWGPFGRVDAGICQAYQSFVIADRM